MTESEIARLEGLSEIDIAWLAGLLEGEGSFLLDNRSAKRFKVSTSPPSPFIKIQMTDEDVIKKVATMVNKNVFSPTRKTVKSKTTYSVHIGDRPTLRILLPRLFPYLGARRQAQAQDLLNALKDHEKWLAEDGLSKMAKEGPKAKKKS